MTTQQVAGAGLRHVDLLAIDANGIPLASGTATNGYEGLHLALAKALTLTTPEANVVQMTGDDRVGGQIALGPTEMASFELRTGKDNLEADALLSDVSVVDIGDMKAILQETCKRGQEPEVCVLAYQQAVDTQKGSATRGSTHWIWYLFPRAKLVQQPPSREEGAQAETTYMGYPQVVESYPWAISFATGTEGAEEGQYIRGIAQNPVKIEAWLGDGLEVDFLWTDTPAVDSAGDPKCTVWHWVLSTETSSDVTSSVTLDTTDITFVTAPADGDIVIAFYELADVPC